MAILDSLTIDNKSITHIAKPTDIYVPNKVFKNLMAEDGVELIEFNEPNHDVQSEQKLNYVLENGTIHFSFKDDTTPTTTTILRPNFALDRFDYVYYDYFANIPSTEYKLTFEPTSYNYGLPKGAFTDLKVFTQNQAFSGSPFIRLYFDGRKYRSLDLTIVLKKLTKIHNEEAFHLARYEELVGNAVENCVNEKLLLNGEGYHDKVRDGSHYTFYGSSEVVESDNLINLKDANYNNYGLNIKISNNTITLNGSTTSMAYLYFDIDKIPSGTYNACWFNDVANNDIYSWGSFEDGTGCYNFQTRLTNVNQKVDNFTIVNPIVKFNIRIPENTTLNNYVIKPMFSVNPITTYTPYFEPFIQNRGTRGKWVDLGGLNWTFSTQGGGINRAYTYRYDVKPTLNATTKANIYLKDYENINSYDLYIKTQYSNYISVDASGTILIMNESFTSAMDVKAKLNGVMFWYETTDTTADYYITDLGTPINIGSEPLRQGDTYCTNGERVNRSVSVYLDGSDTAFFRGGGDNGNGVSLSVNWAFSTNNSSSSMANFRSSIYPPETATSVISTAYETLQPRKAGGIWFYNNYYFCVCFENEYWNSIGVTDATSWKTYLQTHPFTIEYSTNNIVRVFLQSYEFEAGLSGADLETPRYKLDYNYVESIEVDGVKHNLNVAILNNGSLVNNLLSNEYAIVNAWELDWTYGGDVVFRTYHPVKNMKGYDYNTEIVEQENLIYESATAQDVHTHVKERIIGADEDGKLHVYDSRLGGNTDKFIKYIQDIKLQIIYKLANPISNVPIDTPSTPTALECNVNADSKGVNIKYAKQN